MDDRDARIRDEAYRMWVDAGRPEGAAEQYWYEAERSVLKSEASTAPVARKPRAAKGKAEPVAAVQPVAKNAGNSGVASPARAATKGEQVDVMPIKTPIRAPRRTKPSTP